MAVLTLLTNQTQGCMILMRDFHGPQSLVGLAVQSGYPAGRWWTNIGPPILYLKEMSNPQQGKHAL